jgi:DNA polymerase III subunit epsilon
MPKSVIYDKPLSFVDVETTGTNAVNGRIIEIGIIKVYEDRVVTEFESLINPELRIDPFIEQMTGIGLADLENAPVFAEVKDQIYEILYDSIFVAHNVRFDYSFIKNEFRRHEVSFKARHFDTVKLARTLYPGHSHYNLDAIMERHEITNKMRHRAMGDAKVLWEFFKKAKDTMEKDVSQESIDALPESPGVYIFYGESGPLYIGKSINLKDRVLSHFANDSESNTDMKIRMGVKSIEVQETAGELSALLLESFLIKKHKPLYNKVLRESKKMHVIVKGVNAAGYNTLNLTELESVPREDIANILGVFRSSKQAKDFVYGLAKEKKLCLKVLGFEKGKGYCFNYQLGLCGGACVERESCLRYNLRFDEAFFARKIKAWLFGGPVLIKEVGEKTELHLIDNWCYLGSIKNESESIEDVKREYFFDYDTYKILKRHLSNPKNFQNVIVIQPGHRSGW